MLHIHRNRTVFTFFKNIFSSKFSKSCGRFQLYSLKLLAHIIFLEILLQIYNKNNEHQWILLNRSYKSFFTTEFYSFKQHGRTPDYYKTHLITLPNKGIMKTRPAGGRHSETLNRYSKQGGKFSKVFRCKKKHDYLISAFLEIFYFAWIKTRTTYQNKKNIFELIY